MRIALALIVLVLVSTRVGFGDDAPPPATPGPAIELPHFPDRLHAFVWRNWGVAAPSRIAAALDTPQENVRAIATSMGLPADPHLPDTRRIYLSIIRRNWHLLPYDQLLKLLDWTPARLAHALREDDFLWIKLGMNKPVCERIVWAEPTPQAKERAARIKRVVDEVFGAEMKTPAEAPFAFLKELEEPARVEARPAKTDGLRLLYSYPAVYGDPLLDPTLDPYPDGLLQRLSAQGVNGVWLHTVLRDLAPHAAFPEFGKDSEKRLATLNRLVARAARHGIGVYLYVNEPRAMPAAFFKARPGLAQLAGASQGDHTALCTSRVEVRNWLADSLEHIFKNVPGLAGAFTITASENFTNCASHNLQASCPHCKTRSAAEIIAEVNATISQGVHRANPNAKVVVWDWGWSDAAAPDTIARLPKSVSLMSVSEWSIPIQRAGTAVTVGEYSLSVVGPGPRAQRHWHLARTAGLKTIAKVQANNTWELSAIPWIPVLDLVAEHAQGLAAANADGLMLSWTLGGYPSPNLEVFHRITSTRPTPATASVLDEIARQRYGEGGPHARRAWSGFSDAFQLYPYAGNVIYRCPAQFGPANLLHRTPTGRPSTMIGFPYDDAKGWSNPYDPARFADAFAAMADKWETAIGHLAEAARLAPEGQRSEALRDVALARAAGLHFRSVADQTRFVLARDALSKNPALRDELIRLLRSDADSAVKLFALARQDSRIGFEASNHYYYLPHDLIEKYLNCTTLVEHYQRH